MEKYHSYEQIIWPLHIYIIQAHPRSVARSTLCQKQKQTKPLISDSRINAYLFKMCLFPIKRRGQHRKFPHVDYYFFKALLELRGWEPVIASKGVPVGRIYFSFLFSLFFLSLFHSFTHSFTHSFILYFLRCLLC